MEIHFHGVVPLYGVQGVEAKLNKRNFFIIFPFEVLPQKIENNSCSNYVYFTIMTSPNLQTRRFSQTQICGSFPRSIVSHV